MRNRRAIVLLITLTMMLAAITFLLLRVVAWRQVQYLRDVGILPVPTLCPTPSACVPNPDNRRIAFSSNRLPGGGEIYVMNADGTCPTRLTDFPNRHAPEDPQWSPDGTQILFTLYFNLGTSFSGGWSDMDLYVVTADGSHTTRLTRRGENFSGRWSPDGSKIAFLSDRDGYWALYVMNADGSQETRLTDVEVADKYGEMVWSPDGTLIAFTGLHPEEGQSEVYVVSVDGGQVVNLSSHPAADKVITWLPKENKILFTSNRSPDGEASQRWQLYLMDTDGTNVQQIATLGSNPYHRVRGWSPTSTLQLVLSEWHQVSILDVECALENPSESEALPEGCYYRVPMPYSQSPSVSLQWCPGAPQLTFEVVRGHGDGSDIVVMNFDGTEVMNLTNCSADNRDPDWSP